MPDLISYVLAMGAALAAGLLAMAVSAVLVEWLALPMWTANAGLVLAGWWGASAFGVMYRKCMEVMNER